jgi:uncharacterized protein (DUF1499 family)
MIKRTIIAALVVLATPFVVLLILRLTSRKPANVGVPTMKLAPCPSKDNCVCSQDEGESRIDPLPLGVNPNRTWIALREMVRNGERMTLVVDEPFYLHVESRTAVFGFVDDLEFVRDSDARVIHVRSAARSGKYDFNANRRRIERIRMELARVATPQ